MLRIRTEQMNAMRQGCFEGYIRQMLEDRNGDAPPTEVRAIRNAAIEFGFTELRGLPAFVTFVKEIGVDWRNNPEYQWMEAALADPDVSLPAQRLERVRDMHRRREERAAANQKAERLFGNLCQFSAS